MAPSLRVASALLALATCAALTGCSAAPATETDREPFDLGEQELGGTVTELVPVNDVVRVACRAEVNRRHCGTAEAEKAVKSCAAKLPASGSCKSNPSACFKREAKNLSCQATAESYTSLAACAAPISRNCAFYAQCLDKAVGCGESGYALGFGEKYCNGFRRTEFSAQGATWVNSVMICLQKALVPTVQSATNGYRNASLTGSTADVCGATLDRAFASHRGCYTQPEASICFLGPADIAKIFGVIGAREAFTARTTSQIATTIGTCVGQVARAIVGVPLSAPGTNAPAVSDDHLVRANITSLRNEARAQELLAQREVWLAYAKQYGVEVP